MPYSITREDAERDLRALRSVLSGFPVGVSSSAIPAIRELADSIEEQVKPAIEEPAEFGSIVRAVSPNIYGDLWTPSPQHGAHYWQSDVGGVEVWSELADVEVLRVGVGDEPFLEQRTSLAFTEGFDAACNEILKDLTRLRDDAITGEREDAYDKAIAAVEHQRSWK